MEEASILYESHGLTIMDTSAGLIVEFDDDDVKHGFTIVHEKLNDPSVWKTATTNLCDWVDPA